MTGRVLRVAAAELHAHFDLEKTFSIGLVCGATDWHWRPRFTPWHCTHACFGCAQHGTNNSGRTRAAFATGCDYGKEARDGLCVEARRDLGTQSDYWMPRQSRLLQLGKVLRASPRNNCKRFSLQAQNDVKQPRPPMKPAGDDAPENDLKGRMSAHESRSAHLAPFPSS